MFVLRPVPHHFAVWAVLAPLLLVEMSTLDALLRTLALQDGGRARVAQARVVGQRSTADGPQVRYEFRLAGGGATFSGRSALSGPNQWVPVTPAAWAEAQRSGALAIAYLPEDPWTNQPLGRAGHPVADGLLTWGLFLAFDMIWLAETAAIMRNFAACLAMVERRRPHRTRFWESRHVPDPRYSLGSW